MELNFSISEFIIEPEIDIPQEIADKILKYHIIPLQGIRDILKSPMTISERSGYRSLDYELSRGRSGDSEHCYRGKGACDVTVSGAENLRVLGLLLLCSPYTRICFYPGDKFYHLDYKQSDHRLYTGPAWKRFI